MIRPAAPGRNTMRALGALVLITWVLLAPDNRGSFPTAASCEAAATAWQRQARDGTRWVAQQRQAAQGQQDELFWRQAVRRAAEQEAWARGARCVERS
jgi:hypothetical protein